MRLAARSGWNGSSASRFFAHAHELQGLTRDAANGERRAAARVAVHFGEDDARDAQALVKLVGRFDRVLPGHGIGHEEDFDGIELLFELLQFGHQVFVDMQAAGGIHQHHIAAGWALRGGLHAPIRGSLLLGVPS
jgi:hypothetical protein